VGGRFGLLTSDLSPLRRTAELQTNDEHSTSRNNAVKILRGALGEECDPPNQLLLMPVRGNT
jgi:hypothetical protein